MLNCDNEADFTEALRVALFVGVQDVRRDIKARNRKELMDRLHLGYRNYQMKALHSVYMAGRTNEEIAQKARLEYLRGQLRAECISYDEIAELQRLVPAIAPSDVELLEAAGVPETK